MTSGSSVINMVRFTFIGIDMSRPLSLLNTIPRDQMASDYIYVSGCLRPRTIHISDSFGMVRDMPVDCGNCYNCRLQKMDEWVTRMILHSYSSSPRERVQYTSPWRYVYFVTLTYGSYNLFEYSKHPFLSDWLATYPTCDNWNSTGVPAWGPSILVPQHVTKFLKRLRRANEGNMISYVRASEYGEDWGRPHHHLIIWSHKPLRLSSFEDAWSLQVSASETIDPDTGLKICNSFRGSGSFKTFKIGRVDVEDLCANGTLSNDASVSPDSSHDARKNFQYVAKYVNKYDVDFNEYTIKRFLKVFYSLPFTEGVDGSLAAPDSHRDLNFCNIYKDVVYENLDFNNFKKVVAPSFSSSTKYSIGKHYALANLPRFDSGDFSLPSWRGRSLVFPRFFYHLLGLFKNPLRLEKVTISGTSFNKGDSVALYDFLLSLRDSACSLSDLSFTRSFADSTFVKKIPSDNNLCEFVLHSPKDVRRMCYNRLADQFELYTYHRSSRSYVLCDIMDRFEGCDYLLHIIYQDFVNSQQLDIKFDQALELYHIIEGDTSKVCSVPESDFIRVSDFIDPVDTILSDRVFVPTYDSAHVLRVRDTYLEYRKRKNVEYKQKHKSLNV